MRLLPGIGLAAVISVTACDSLLTKPSLYSSVPVVVARTNGDGIPGARVVLYTGDRPMGYGITDSSGQFLFTQVPQGVYGITALPPTGYVSRDSLIGGPPTNVADQIAVQGDSVHAVVRFSFVKRGPGTLIVRLTQPTGAPIAGAVVTVYDPAAIRGKVTTDVSGKAVFNSLPFGVYGVSVERPYLYRDFQKLGDSAFAFRDRLIVEDGIRDSVPIVLTKCAGSIRVSAVDQTSAPVPGTTAVVYVSTGALARTPTASDGKTRFDDLPCATQLGVIIVAPPGYAVAEGRGSSYFDGFTLGKDQTLDLAFRLQKVF